MKTKAACYLFRVFSAVPWRPDPRATCVYTLRSGLVCKPWRVEAGEKPSARREEEAPAYVKRKEDAGTCILCIQNWSGARRHWRGESSLSCIEEPWHLRQGGHHYCVPTKGALENAALRVKCCPWGWNPSIVDHAATIEEKGGCRGLPESLSESKNCLIYWSREIKTKEQSIIFIKSRKSGNSFFFQRNFLKGFYG